MNIKFACLPLSLLCFKLHLNNTPSLQAVFFCTMSMLELETINKQCSWLFTHPPPPHFLSRSFRMSSLYFSTDYPFISAFSPFRQNKYIISCKGNELCDKKGDMGGVRRQWLLCQYKARNKSLFPFNFFRTPKNINKSKYVVQNFFIS